MLRNIFNFITFYLVAAVLVFLFSGCKSTFTTCSDIIARFRPEVSETISSPEAIPGDDIVVNVVSAGGDDPFQAGVDAAMALQQQMGSAVCHAVIVADHYKGQKAKERMLKGVSSVIGARKVFGFSSYGSFGQDGCSEDNTVRIAGIGGEGISVTAALQRKLGVTFLTVEKDEHVLSQRLNWAGMEIGKKVRQADDASLMILLADAHSPKNSYLIDGVHSELGRAFPITGGSANKEPGQSFVYYQGQMYEDSAVAIMLSGHFNISMAGREGRGNSRFVVSSVGEAFSEAITNIETKPFAVFAFNSQERKSRLRNAEDELKEMQKMIGTETPIFGTYCAGEFGPSDAVDKTDGALSSGQQRHLMVTLLGR